MMEEFKSLLVIAYNQNQDKGIKFVERALQKVIEDRHPDKCWWEVCKTPIFRRLYDGIAPDQLIDEIVMSCELA